jgi:hypothetical protein
MNVWEPNRDDVAAYLRQLAGQIEDGVVEVRSVVAYGSTDGIVWCAGDARGPYLNVSITGVLHEAPRPGQLYIDGQHVGEVESFEIDFGEGLKP